MALTWGDPPPKLPSHLDRVRALADAVEEGRRIEGPDIKHWQYGAYLRITIDNPVIHRVPLVGKYFDIGPAPITLFAGVAP